MKDIFHISRIKYISHHMIPLVEQDHDAIICPFIEVGCEHMKNITLNCEYIHATFILLISMWDKRFNLLHVSEKKERERFTMLF